MTLKELLAYNPSAVDVVLYIEALDPFVRYVPVTGVRQAPPLDADPENRPVLILTTDFNIEIS